MISIHRPLGNQQPCWKEILIEDNRARDVARRFKVSPARISQIVSKIGKRFSFFYEYDFGDSWEHEILFEGCPVQEPGKKYPLCLEGERACPPEDVGGIYGFYEFLEALADPKHERHDDFMEWAGDFDPKNFDAKQATKVMKKGLPDWRE